MSDRQFYAIRHAVSLDNDPAAVYVFEFGTQKHKRYSDEAIKAVREFIESGKLDQAIAEYNARQSRPGSRRKQ